jgi:hypothetical protein
VSRHTTDFYVDFVSCNFIKLALLVLTVFVGGVLKAFLDKVSFHLQTGMISFCFFSILMSSTCFLAYGSG